MMFNFRARCCTSEVVVSMCLSVVSILVQDKVLRKVSNCFLLQVAVERSVVYFYLLASSGCEHVGG